MSNNALTLSEMQAVVDRHISQFKEGYWPPLSMMARVTEEVGELAREVNHRFGAKKKRADEPEGDLGMEMADILFILICMANAQNIDLEAKFRAILEKYQVRDRDRFERNPES